MTLFKLFFISMTFRYARALRDPATRLTYSIPGPFLVVAGIAFIFMRMPPALSVSIFVAGSSLMRIQASMIERCPWKSLRNGALVILAFMIFFVVIGDYVWTIVGVAIAVGLLFLHRHHEAMLGRRDYRSQIAAAQAAAEAHRRAT